MDTHSLGFAYNEHFAFESSDYLNIDDESQSTDAGNLGWEEWEVEQEINGDVALIPMSSEVGLNYLSTSPPGKDFHRIMNDWHALTNLEISSIDDIATGVILEDESPSPYNDLPKVKTEIPSPATAPATPSISDRKLNVAKSTGKKIDMQAQCYIIRGTQSDNSDSENELCDVENTSVIENSVHVKTELVDVIENEVPELNLKTEVEDVQSDEISVEIESPIKEELDSSYGDLENDFIDVDTISNHGIPILEAGDVDSLLEQFEATESNYLKPISSLSEEEIFEPTNLPHNKVTETSTVEKQTSNTDKQINDIEKQVNNIETQTKKAEDKQTNIAEKQTNHIVEKQTTDPVETLSNSTNTEDDSNKNKQILNALPQELIQRIKASSKRKTVPVIDPIPTKKRGVKRPHNEQPLISQEKDKPKEQSYNSYFVQLDHDYCSLIFPYPKHPKKDSGFESAEEDEQRNVLRNQPTVKGADGKLMVSLLKVNTIRNSVNNDNANKKKKLNLAEYKKRRCIKSCDNSQNNSPNPSRPNSPIKEDERERLIKHQQKLMQMAADVLKTPPKSARKSLPLPQLENLPTVLQSPAPTTPVQSPAPTPSPAPTVPPTPALTPPPPPRVPPDNVVVKVIVSVGVNTENEEAPVPVSEFKEIQPLLKKASTKISNNSLIASVLENIKNKKTSKPDTHAENKQTQAAVQVHGEDKTIVYLDKNRPTVKTVSVEVQTDPPKAATTKRSFARRRNSSNSSEEYKSRRSGSTDSRYSYSSHSSYSSRSRSTSRSPSPRRYRKRFNDHDRERVREVEERRIVYVGGIDQNTTKEMLKRRFQRYGPITNVSVHFREYGDNYGFVTFLYKIDAYNAVEHGNDDPTLPRFDLSFGGRRIFCRTNYSDLDNVHDEGGYKTDPADDSFDALLREAQAKLRKRKACT